jgi:hypothetical protein
LNIHQYTGLPYSFRHYNCWEHVRNVRADAGLETPEFDAATPAEIEIAFDGGHSDPQGLEQVSEPQDLDAVLMATRRGNRMIWHSGVYWRGMVSHCEMVAKQVRLEPLSAIAERYERIEFWR